MANNPLRRPYVGGVGGVFPGEVPPGYERAESGLIVPGMDHSGPINYTIDANGKVTPLAPDIDIDLSEIEATLDGLSGDLAYIKDIINNNFPGGSSGGEVLPPSLSATFFLHPYKYALWGGGVYEHTISITTPPTAKRLVVVVARLDRKIDTNNPPNTVTLDGQSATVNSQLIGDGPYGMRSVWGLYSFTRDKVTPGVAQTLQVDFPPNVEPDMVILPISLMSTTQDNFDTVYSASITGSVEDRTATFNSYAVPGAMIGVYGLVSVDGTVKSSDSWTGTRVFSINEYRGQQSSSQAPEGWAVEVYVDFANTFPPSSFNLKGASLQGGGYASDSRLLARMFSFAP